MIQKRLVLPLSPKSILRQLLDDPRSDDKLKAKVLKLLSRPLGWKVLPEGRPRVGSDEFLASSARRLLSGRETDPKLRFEALLQTIE